MVVGQDGRVTTAYSTLSGVAIEALLNCFAHVVWTDEYGRQYYDILEAALREQSYDTDTHVIFDGVFSNGLFSTSQKYGLQIETRNDRVIFGLDYGEKPYVSSVDGSDLGIYPVPIPEDAKSVIITFDSPSLYMSVSTRSLDKTENKYGSAIRNFSNNNSGFAFNVQNGEEYLAIVFRLSTSENIDFDDSTLPSMVNIAFLKAPIYE